MKPNADKLPVSREAGWELDTGEVRSNNEDSLAVINVDQASAGDKQSVGIYAVADGVGGSQRGEEASKLAVRTAVRQLMSGLTEASDEEPMPDHYHACTARRRLPIRWFIARTPMRRPTWRPHW